MEAQQRTEQDLLSLLTPLTTRVGANEPAVIQPLQGQASVRRYHRLALGQQSFIVMELGTDPYRCEEICEAPPLRAEPPFIEVQRYLQSGDVAVPQVIDYFANEGVIVLEDLGNRTLVATGWTKQWHVL